MRLGVAGLVGLLTFALFTSWPRPSVTLRGSCEWVAAGRFGFECDVAGLAQRSGRDWVRGDVRLYEDGVLLRGADQAGDVRRRHAGSFHTDGRLLTFAALDGGDPRTNGRDYVLRPARGDGPLGLPRRPVRIAVGVLLAAVLAAAWRWRGRIGSTWLADATIGATVGCLAVQLLGMFGETPVNVDAGYLLPSAEAVAAGARPHRDLFYAYTPLGLYELAGWSALWPGAGATPYNWYLLLVALAEAACAALVYLLLRRLGVSSPAPLLTALSCLSLTIAFDGARILLEPLVHLPILAAALVTLGPETRRRAWLAGGLAAVAFATKQYGGFALLGLGLYTLLRGFRSWRWGLHVFGGFVAAVAVAVGALALAGVAPGDLWANAFAGSYPRRYESVWLKQYLWLCPLVPPAIAAPFVRGLWARNEVRLLVAFGVASCAPFYFRQQQYYFLNVTPWIFLLFAAGAHALASDPRRRGLVSAVATLLLVSIPLRAAERTSALLDVDWRSEQVRRTRKMQNAWPAGRPALVFVTPAFVALTRYTSAAPTVLGYRFLNECPAEDLRAGFAGADAAWLDPSSMYARGADRAFQAEGRTLEEELAAQGFTRQVVIEDRFELWQRGAAEKAGSRAR